MMQTKMLINNQWHFFTNVFLTNNFTQKSKIAVLEQSDNITLHQITIFLSKILEHTRNKVIIKKHTST